MAEIPYNEKNSTVKLKQTSDMWDFFIIVI